MKLPTVQFGILLTVLGLVAGAPGRVNGDIVLDPGTLYENRLGYVIDRPGHSFDLAYNVSSIIAALPAPGGSPPISDGGTSSYSTSDVAVSNMNSGTASGTSFYLKSTADAAILSPVATFAEAHAYNEYIANFHLTTPQTFTASVSLSATASVTGPVSSYEYLALAYLYDTTTGENLYDIAYVYSFGQGSFYGMPTSVDLLADHEYSLAGETFALAQVVSSPGSALGSASGMAEARFSLTALQATAVPEPSSLTVAGVGALALLLHRSRPRPRRSRA